MSISDYFFAAYSIIAGPFVLWMIVDTIVDEWRFRKALKEHASWAALYVQMVQDQYEWRRP